jgi:hypothetical protein
MNTYGNDVTLFFSVACNFRAVDGHKDKYYNEIARVEQYCAPGTLFDPDLCRCTNNPQHSSPRMMFFSLHNDTVYLIYEYA